MVAAWSKKSYSGPAEISFIVCLVQFKDGGWGVGRMQGELCVLLQLNSGVQQEHADCFGYILEHEGASYQPVFNSIIPVFALST